jgi:hypothetical protein
MLNTPPPVRQAHVEHKPALIAIGYSNELLAKRHRCGGQRSRQLSSREAATQPRIHHQSYHIYGATLDFLIGPEAEHSDGDYDSVRFDELTQILPHHGIETIKLRGTGATGTIYDPYETNIEFARTVGQVERLLNSYTEGIITEITLRARESDPRLLETLHAALDALERDAGREFLRVIQK